MKKNNMFRNGLFYLLVLFLVIGIISLATGGSSNAQSMEISSTEFVEEIEEGNVKSFTIQPSAGVYEVRGEYVTPKTPETTNDNFNFLMGQPSQTQVFQTTLLQNDPSVQEVFNALDNTKTQMKILKEEQPSVFWMIVSSILPFILFIGLMYMMMGQAGQGGKGGRGVMSFGKSTAKLTDPSESKVTFADVAGAEEEKAELVEIVEFLKDPKKFTNLGATIPSGVLLEGPPGTGKTLLAKAVAGEAGVPFYSISGSEFVEMFVGVGASRVRDLFVEAKKNSPAIIFIDEIDAVGRKRGSGQGGGNDEREQTLNQLLVEMDGFSGKEGVIVIAATNRADVLDQALLRPGRFDRRILVGMPDVKEREAILRVHAKNKPLSKEVDLKQVAKTTPGFAGADLENLLNEAALVAARRDSNVIEPFDVDEAADRVIAGPAKRDRVIAEDERKRVAYHEAGHTIIGLVLSDARTVHKVTIVPRGRAGGYAIMMPREDRHLLTTKDLYEQIVGLLGGRSAEEHFFDSKSTGASNDFEQATNIARQMVTKYGMSDSIGVVQYESDSQEGPMFSKPYSEQLAYEIDIEIRSILDKAHKEAHAIIADHEEQLTVIAEKLLEVETLNEKEILSLFNTGQMPETSDDDEFPKEAEVSHDQAQAGKSYDEVRQEAEEFSKKREARYSDEDPEDVDLDEDAADETEEKDSEPSGRNAHAQQDRSSSDESEN